jgi:spoIIIJ-associated protein
VIRARIKPLPQAGDLVTFLDHFLEVFPLDLTYELKTKNDFDFVIFGGGDKQLLLWKDGALLLAIQHLLNKISDRKVQVDCEFFRKRKEKSLHEYALDVARRVSASNRNEILDLMNPYERRIVHIAANEVPGITSESLGEGFLKRVKVFPLNKRPR